MVKYTPINIIYIKHRSKSVYTQNKNNKTPEHEYTNEKHERFEYLENKHVKMKNNG